MNHLIIFLLSLVIFVNAQVYEGYTLFTPMNAFDDYATTYFMNNEFDILHTWMHDQGPASMPYLLPDSSIIYPYRVPFPSMNAGGVGGGIQKQSWEGEILWEYEFANEQYQHHHDVEPLPNGNILIIVWENKTAQEAYDLGREIIDNPINAMWSSAILELEAESGEIVWEWHIWDHTVQDVNSELSNFGIISEHPELFDINRGSVGINAGGPQAANADWMHINAVDYNPILDQIVLSSRLQDEIFIIDHSTTTEEAASHLGGNSDKGGDFLYRWGNPVNYGRGDELDQILGDQHSVNWIPEGYPGAGNLILFNNTHNGNNSAVLEFTTPVNENGEYFIDESEPFGPESWEWIYMGDITTPMQGGAFRLPNGNTLITQTHTATVIEVDYEGNELWSFTYDGGYWIARCEKYSPDYLENLFLGDMNSDGSLNILDIVILTNLILDEDTSNPLGDLNQDGNQNILDIIVLVNLILV